MTDKAISELKDRASGKQSKMCGYVLTTANSQWPIDRWLAHYEAALSASIIIPVTLKFRYNIGDRSRRKQ